MDAGTGVEPVAPDHETGMLPLHHPTMNPLPTWQRDYLLVRNMISTEETLIAIILSK